MQSRFIFTGLFLALILALILCAMDSWRRYKALGKAVAWLDISLIPPILGNAIIILAQTKLVSLFGRYVYFLGMDFVVYELMCFTKEYCKGAGHGLKIPKWINIFLIADAVQLLLNPFFGHAFDIEPIIFEGATYYTLIPYIGQTYHRIVDYGFLFLALFIYVMSAIKSSKVYRERYTIIVVSIIVLGAWETYYIFSKIPIDRSMIGFGMIGIIIYYFAVHYRPLRLLDRILSGVVSNGSEALFIFTPKGKCVWTNKEGCYLVGVQEDNCENAPELLEWLFDTKMHKGNWTEQHVTGSGEDMKYYLLENRDVMDEEKRFSGYDLKVRDITDEKLKMKKDFYDATHDKLTGLYTKERLLHMIKMEMTSHLKIDYLILYINVKNYKIINDIFGTDFGDYALKTIAENLMKQMSEHCVYGKIGPDNFGVLLPREKFEDEKVEAALSKFTIKNDKAEYPVNIQIGVYEVAHDSTDIATMLGRARLAVSSLEVGYNKHIAYYTEEIRKEIMWEQEIAAQLPDAIKNRDIKPFLQPIVDTDGTIVGAEALVRWIHKEYGFLAPYKFIPAFEKNGMIAEVDKYMWRCACEILADWQKRGLDLFISVNISPKDFYYMNVPKYIRELVAEYKVDPSKLRVEITETVMMNDTDKIIGILNEFRGDGLIVEMDDFGSGYSSLNMLKDMPVDVLKIDMKFLGKSENEKKADTIVKNIINLSRELGMTSLTEGVETHIQYTGLSEMGCRLFQGYYFSKPISVEQFEELLDEKKHEEISQ